MMFSNRITTTRNAITDRFHALRINKKTNKIARVLSEPLQLSFRPDVRHDLGMTARGLVDEYCPILDLYLYP
jgi:hypothetical protein